MYVRGVIRIKSTGQKNLNRNQVKDSLCIIFDINAADPDATFSVLHPLPKGSNELILGNSPDRPFPARLEAVLGQQEANQLKFTSGREKVH